MGMKQRYKVIFGVTLLFLFLVLVNVYLFGSKCQTVDLSNGTFLHCDCAGYELKVPTDTQGSFNSYCIGVITSTTVGY